MLISPRCVGSWSRKAQNLGVEWGSKVHTGLSCSKNPAILFHKASHLQILTASAGLMWEVMWLFWYYLYPKHKWCMKGNDGQFNKQETNVFSTSHTPKHGQPSRRVENGRPLTLCHTHKFSRSSPWGRVWTVRDYQIMTPELRNKQEN